jgi:hypothetical protein
MSYHEYDLQPPTRWQSLVAYRLGRRPLTVAALPFIIAAGWCFPLADRLAAAGVVAGTDWWLNVRLSASAATRVRRRHDRQRRAVAQQTTFRRA